MNINRHWILVFALVSSTSFAGSAAQKTLEGLTAEKPGSPYHWVSENVGGGKTLERELMGKPGKTVADDTVKNDIVRTIGGYEQNNGGSPTPTIVEIRQLPKTGDSYNEVWVVSRSGAGIAYTVSLQAAAKGGVDFHVQGPWE